MSNTRTRRTALLLFAFGVPCHPPGTPTREPALRRKSILCAPRANIRSLRRNGFSFRELGPSGPLFLFPFKGSNGWDWLPAPSLRRRTVERVFEHLETHLSSKGKLRAYAGFLGGVAVISALTVPWVVVSAIDEDISPFRAALLVGVLVVWFLSSSIAATWCLITDSRLRHTAEDEADLDDDDVSKMMRSWRASWPEADEALSDLDDIEPAPEEGSATTAGP